MKFIKKAAALFFCAALALSVMAISAMASEPDPEPDGGASTPAYTLTLSQDSTDTHVGSTLNNQTDENATQIVDYQTGDTVKYKITLAATDTNADTTPVDVNALQFTLTYDTGLTIKKVYINSTDISAKYPSAISPTVIQYLRESDSTSNINAISVTHAGTDIGYIEFTTSNAGSVPITPTFSVSNATTHPEAGVTSVNIDTPTTGDATASAQVEIHPVYKITLMTPTFGDNYVKTSTTEAVVKESTDTAGLVIDYDFVNGIANSGTIAASAASNSSTYYNLIDHAHYTFAGWDVEATSNSAENWDDTISTTTAYPVPTGKYGNVTLTAVYTPDEYEVTYAESAKTRGDNEAKSVSLTPKTEGSTTVYTYTIETPAADFGTASRDGYTFNGWKASNAASGATWTDDTTYVTSGSGNVIAAMYGNVTLTPDFSATPYDAIFDVGNGNATTTPKHTTATELKNGNTALTSGSSRVSYTMENFETTLAAVTVTRVGYDFDGWKVTTHGGNWESDEVVDEDTAATPVVAGDFDAITNYDTTGAKYGNVTFTAQWTPHDYTVTVTKGVDTTYEADVTLTGVTATYNIESISGLTSLSATRNGYTFAGWKVTSVGEDVGISPEGTAASGVVWAENDVYGTASGQKTFTEGQYGTIQLTPLWTLNGTLKQVNYNFAHRDSDTRTNSRGDCLVLFAVVNSANANLINNEGVYTGAYTYTIGGTSYEMFRIPSDKYASTFAWTNGEESSYTVFATIAPEVLTTGENPTADDATALTYVAYNGSETANVQIAATGTPTNTMLVYDGNVNGETGVDVGDYGTAGTIFSKPTSYQSNIGIANRLKMDMSDTAQNSTDTWLGDILDLKAIMNAALS